MRKKQPGYEPEYIALEKKLRGSQREVYNLAKKQGYLKQKDDKGERISSAFYHWCDAFNRPYIVIKEGRDTSVINLDFPAGKYLSESTLEQLWEIVIRYCDPLEDNYISYVRHVPNEEVDQVAQEIIDLFNQSSDEPQEFSEEVLNEKIKRMLAEKFERSKGKGGSFSGNRDKDIVTIAKKKAGGVCQLCNKKAPFKDRHGNPYLEVHHVKWLSRGGEDIVENVAALCPNCHKKMHVLDLPDDRISLLKKAKSPF